MELGSVTLKINNQHTHTSGQGLRAGRVAWESPWWWKRRNETGFITVEKTLKDPLYQGLGPTTKPPSMTDLSRHNSSLSPRCLVLWFLILSLHLTEEEEEEKPLCVCVCVCVCVHAIF